MLAACAHSTSVLILPLFCAELPDVDGKSKVTRAVRSPRPFTVTDFVSLTVAGRKPMMTNCACGCSMLNVTDSRSLMAGWWQEGAGAA